MQTSSDSPLFASRPGAGRSCPMSENLRILVAAAAELRAGGYSWESIAEKLRRPLKTCQNWPNKQPRLWARYFRPAQLRLGEPMAMEARSRLHAFMRDVDKKLSYKANELIMKHSAAAYGPVGSATLPDPGPKEPLAGNAEIHARLSRVLDEARTEIDRKRAKAGQPPVSNAEFMAEWQKELESRPPKREPIKVDFDKDGNAIDPPEETKPPEPSAAPEASAGPAQAGGALNRDIVWGVLLLVSVLIGRVSPGDVEPIKSHPGAMPTALRGHVDVREGEASMPAPSRGHGTRQLAEVSAFHGPNDGLRERGQVVRLAGRNDVPIDHRLLVDVGRP